MLKDQPIGIFDSGVGGLTVASAIHRLLPKESFIYFGDTLRAPYGDKSAARILEYSRQISSFLIDSQCKAIVIACNSASAAAFEELKRDWPDIPILNVIDPVVAELGRLNARKVGLIATRATVKSGVYARRLKLEVPSMEIVQKATPLLAPLVEEGFAGTEVSAGALNHYLNDAYLSDLSHLILGCTHYPLLEKEIFSYFDGKVEVLNSASLVAIALKALLKEESILSDQGKAELKFFVSEKTEAFSETAKLFFGQEIDLEEKLLRS